MKEHQRKVDSISLNPVPEGVKLINTTWAMKKKHNGTLRGWVIVRGFKQINGQHYNGTSISAPVTNTMTSRIALSIVLIQGSIAHIVDVKGTFLYGEFKDARRYTSRSHWNLRGSIQATQYFC